MNWLAHIFLSENNIDFQIGNFLADPLKGKIWDGASDDIQKGMLTHSIIDSFTDTHEITSLSKSRLRKKGLLKPVIIDILYDYFLTKNWENFCNQPRLEFIKNFNKNALKKLCTLPTNAKEALINLLRQERLIKYESLNQVKEAFKRIDQRLSDKLHSRDSAVSYFPKIREIEDELEKDFLMFFPLLCSHIKKVIIENDILP